MVVEFVDVVVAVGADKLACPLTPAEIRLVSDPSMRGACRIAPLPLTGGRLTALKVRCDHMLRAHR